MYEEAIKKANTPEALLHVIRRLMQEEADSTFEGTGALDYGAFYLSAHATHAIQQRAIDICTENPSLDLPPVPSGNPVEMQNWCITASKCFHKPSGGQAPDKWQDIQRKLLRLYRQDEPYTSGRVLGRRVGCSAGTIGKAVKHSPDLRKWKAQKAKGRPKAHSLTAPVTESIASEAADPAKRLPDDEVDQRMKFLIAQAKPTERAKLVAMDKDARRRLVEVASEQAEDQFNENHAPKGNRTLGRKP